MGKAALGARPSGFPAGPDRGRPGGAAQLTMDLLGISMGQELVQEGIGLAEAGDGFCGKERRPPALKVVVPALDFAFGLGRRGITQRHAIEVQAGAQLGESVGSVGEEQGMVVQVERQGQAVGTKGSLQEIQVSQERFARIELRADVEAGGVIQKVEQDMLLLLLGQPQMWGGIVLPERTPVPHLPAFDGFGSRFIAGIWSQMVGFGPTADTGPVGLKLEAPQQFAGGSVVGGGWLGTEQAVEQVSHLRRPIGGMIAAGKSGSPALRLPLSTGTQILTVEVMKATPRKLEFFCRRTGWKALGSILGQKMANERSGNTMG
jgi:hypothetical protein